MFVCSVISIVHVSMLKFETIIMELIRDFGNNQMLSFVLLLLGIKFQGSCENKSNLSGVRVVG